MWDWTTHPAWHHLFDLVQWLFIAYVMALLLTNLALAAFAWRAIRRHRDTLQWNFLPQAHGELNLPVSLLVPAFNEVAGIVASVRSLLLLEYPRYEILVINDGSTDGTLPALIEHFDLVAFPEVNHLRIPCAPIHAVYRSRRHPNLRVIDKRNGGKADALNAGINCANYPLVCAVDGDSILRRDALTRAVRPFLEDSRTIVSGASIGIANGCRISGGQLEAVDIGTHFLARMQVLEYLRGFLLARMGWSTLNAILIISGAFGVFNKEVVVRAGGYRTRTIGEDMELIVRLHHDFSEGRTPYRIASVPEPLCWTEAPEIPSVLRSQRARWQRGLAESLALHRSLMLAPRSGAAGWVAMPYYVVFELLGPVVELFGLILLFGGALLGWIDWAAFLATALLAMGAGALVTALALLLETVATALYPKPRQILLLAAYSWLENLGYRQLVLVWRIQGLWRWARGAQHQWGTMTRQASLGDVTRPADLSALYDPEAFDTESLRRVQAAIERGRRT